MTVEIQSRKRIVNGMVIFKNLHRVIYKGHAIADARITPSGLWEVIPARRYYRGADDLVKIMNESQIADFAKKATLRGEPL